jgi:hypothetical protein
MEKTIYTQVRLAYTYVHQQRGTQMNTEANHNRRMAAEHRFLCNQEIRDRKAEYLIGELCIEGELFYYINLKRRSGSFTGKIKQSKSWSELCDYLARNNYI